MTDKLIILAGGISSRMKKQEEISGGLNIRQIKDANEKQKAMIGLGEKGRPFLDYLLFNAVKAGIKEIIIVVGEKDDSIKKYYRENSLRPSFLKPLKITFAVQPLPEGRRKPMGTADALYHGMLAALDWESERFLVCNSDNLYSVKAMRLLMKSDHYNAAIDYDRSGLDFDDERIGRFAVMQKNPEGYLTGIIEKPSNETINGLLSLYGYVGVSMNIFMFSYSMIFPALVQTPFNPERDEKELPDAVKIMLEKYPDSVYTYLLKEHVPDLTSKKDIIPVQEYVLREFSNTEL